MPYLTMRSPDVSLDQERSSAPEGSHARDLATQFTHPQQVLASATLGGSEKRALLASWASDACAVEGLPAWRRWPGAQTMVPVDDILDALRTLDKAGLH